MSSTAARGPAPDSPSGVRPLSSHPNLEYERKQAKQLLRQAREGDPDALNRIRAQRRGDSPIDAAELQLSDAQFTIAREYGFLSWPRLVDYFMALERQERSGPASRQSDRIDFYEGRVQSILNWHRRRVPAAAHFAGAFVPRLYGLSADEVLNTELTMDEARLVVARENKLPSWQALVEFVAKREPRGFDRFTQPRNRAFHAIRNGDLGALSEIVDAHPELLTEVGNGEHTVLSSALVRERRHPSAEATAIRAWLADRAANLGEAVNRMLLGHMRTTPEDVRFALDLGADPMWVPPNGISVIEHAIYRYWNGESVDIVARLVTPPEAYWVAAGLGDVHSLHRYVDAKGRPTEAARRRRPDFMAMGLPMPTLPEADDLGVIWEGWLVAGLNSRFEVMDFLLDRGFPVDHDGMGSPLIDFAVGNGFVDLVEFLVRRGAKLDRPNWRNGGTARKTAEYMFLNFPNEAYRRRILELCGGRDPDELLREAAAQRAAAPLQPAANLVDALRFAEDEAARLGQREVRTDNLFVALLQPGSEMPLVYLAGAGVDMARLRSAVRDRIVEASPRDQKNSSAPRPDLPADAEATQVLKEMQTEAKRRGSGSLNTLGLLWALTRSDTGAVADILRAAGATAEQVRRFCEARKS